MKINLIKKVEILSSNFNVNYNKATDGCSFSWKDNCINIGIKNINNDPSYTLSCISHELMEIILVGMGARFDSSRTGENYLFNLDHQTFENAIQIHTQALIKFIKTK